MGGPQDHDLSGRMAGMDLGGRRPGPGMPGPSQGRPPMGQEDDYRRPSLDSQYPAASRGYQDPRQGPPGQEQNYGFQERSYNGPVSPLSDGFNQPPARSMTMPQNIERPDMSRQALPPRLDSAPAGGQGVGMGQPPSQHMQRPPPQRMYPGQPGQPNPPQPMSPQFLDPGHGNEPARESIGDFYDEYYNDPPGGRDSYQSTNYDQRGSHEYHPQGEYQTPPEVEQHMRPGPGRGTPQPGPARVPELSRTKSQPNFREPQAAVFEMAGDLPPMPPPGNFQAFNPAMVNSPPNDVSTNAFGRGPGLPGNPAPARAGAAPNGQQLGPGSGHPAPVRPGLMANSMVNVNDKPVPVRNYQNAGPPAPAPYAAGPPQPQQAPAQLPPPAARPVSGSAEKVPVTTEELDRLRETIKVNPNDQQSALSLAKKLVEAADTLVPRMPDPKARVRARERYIMDAHKILKKLVSSQNADAMFYLADCMGRGALGHEPDNKEAFTLYQSAAKLGHAAAAYRTAVCCEIGNDDGGGTRKDPLKAIQWYKRAATLGDTPAMYKVGMILLKGLLGQQRNPRESIGWLKRAAERADADNPHALHELGMLYETAQPNDVIIRDEAYALQLFEQAAQLGYKFSQFKLGCAFEYGLMGCPIDPRASISWYSQAAQQGEHQAELALSGWYLTGSDGVLKQSDTEAYLWARKAAQAGLAKAEYAMGYFTEVGIGVPANLDDAKRWYWRAAAQNFPKARERLEDLKKAGRHAPRQRERISRSNMSKQQTDGECSVM
ncbi:uncharacterized protein B0I36DRAFT_237275 [Microdochium trichocladiopsis]|uniref:Chitin synthase regulatory factor 3 n=1 Tax=Microdochium trichocladiopsis TaxID=1682393 RepID=A0A9P9BTN8_9PEZI|nr:uncharacterized protein B0I36DRAFT_237275 [Microdochium trichocladiopsis]KAH7037152.1 hypothetical protein B0I36DRAFT_237275 [Microdochium trichocladiopsis]